VHKHADRIAVRNAHQLSQHHTSTETPDQQPSEIEYTELSENELLIQYQAISHDGTAATMNVSGGCYWAAAGALLSTAGVFAAIPTGGASLWIAYGGTVVSHGGAIQSCA